MKKSQNLSYYHITNSQYNTVYNVQDFSMCIYFSCWRSPALYPTLHEADRTVLHTDWDYLWDHAICGFPSPTNYWSPSRQVPKTQARTSPVYSVFGSFLHVDVSHSIRHYLLYVS